MKLRLLALGNYLIPNKKSALLSVLLIGLVGALMAQLYFYPRFLNQTIGRATTLIADFRSGKLLAEKSSAKVWTEGQSVKVKFSIVEQDKAKFSQFNQKLGSGDEYLKGISLDLDPQTIAFLEKFVPINLNLEVEGDTLLFQNNLTPLFQSSLIKDQKEFATGSGKFSLKMFSDEEFQLNIVDPEPLTKYATSSGQLMLSSKLNGVFPLLSRVGTIDLTVNGKSVNGVIKLH